MIIEEVSRLDEKDTIIS